MRNQEALIGWHSGQNPLLAAAEAHIQRLKDEGLMTEAHDMAAAGLIWAATRVGSPGYPAYSFPNGMKEVREWVAMLPAAANAADPFDTLVKHLESLDAQPAVEGA